MSWATVIPTTMAVLGAYLLVLAVALVFLDNPMKGVPWDKVAAWCAVGAGFGVTGGVAGTVGASFSSAAHGAIAQGQHLTESFLGHGAIAILILVSVLWMVSRAGGKGIDTKSKLKSLFVVVLLGMVGALVAFIPGLYNLADQGVHMAGTGLISILNNVFS